MFLSAEVNWSEWGTAFCPISLFLLWISVDSGTQMIIISSWRIYHIWYSKEWFEPWDQTRPDRCWKSCLCNNYDKHHIWNLVSVSVPGPMQCILKWFQFTTFVLISTFLFRLLIMRHVKNLAEDICKNSFIFIEENKCDKCANRFRIKWRENREYILKKREDGLSNIFVYTWRR